jgi:hypothetical protein
MPYETAGQNTLEVVFYLSIVCICAHILVLLEISDIGTAHAPEAAWVSCGILAVFTAILFLIGQVVTRYGLIQVLHM